MPVGDEKDTGENREHLVAEFLSHHLPRLATVTKSGVLIDSQFTCFQDKKDRRAQQVDVLVLNPFTLLNMWFPAGLYPVESVYLAIEVKSSPSPQELNKAFSQIARVKKLKKAMRPETTYFAFVTERGRPMDPRERTGSPQAGVWIWPNASERNRVKWIEWLRKAICKSLSKNQTDDPRTIKVSMPSFVYVPKKFLAFKVYPQVWDDEKGKMIDTVHKDSEFWFCSEDEQLSFKNGKHDPFQYVIYEPSAEPRNTSRLLILTCWLAQEILKFIHEVPDIFMYAWPREDLKGRQGYAWHRDSFTVFKFNSRGQEP